MSKTLVVFRLFDPAYGKEGNAKTLEVKQNDDNTLDYLYYGGWQSNGMGFSISNMQLKRSLPFSINKFKNTEELIVEIMECLATGVGSNRIRAYEIINEIAKPKVKKEKPTKPELWIGQIPGIFGYGIMVAECTEAECKKILKKHYLDSKKSWGYDKTFTEAMEYFGGSVKKIEYGKSYNDNFGE